jgi:redox-sensitive bicupin YhaK (pirin superfamily)
MVDPSYQELNASGIPSAYPEGPEGPVRIKVISGKSFGVESPVRPLGGCWYFHIIFDKKSNIFHDLPAGWTSFAYILKGRVKVGNEEREHKEFHTLVFSAEPNQTGVRLEGLEDGTELVLVCSHPDSFDATVNVLSPSDFWGAPRSNGFPIRSIRHDHP